MSTKLTRLQVEDETFGKEVTDNLLVGTHLGPMIKHMNWALTLVNALPESFSGRFVPGRKKLLESIRHTLAYQTQVGEGS